MLCWSAGVSLLSRITTRIIYCFALSGTVLFFKKIYNSIILLYNSIILVRPYQVPGYQGYLQFRYS